MVSAGFYSGTAVEEKGGGTGAMVDVAEDRPVWALGLMSGTSMDGVDAAMLLTDGEKIDGFGPTVFVDYDARYRDEMAAANAAARAATTDTLRDPAHWPAALSRLAESAVEVHLDAISRCAGAADVIGFHGQTVAHRPREGFTLQLGDGAALAAGSGVRTVWDFRSEDMRQGGEGAPLAPFFHFALARHVGIGSPVAFLNLGGVGNVTWVDPAATVPEAPGALVAFDTGPANALIDDFMRMRTGQGFDADGAMAERGRASAAVLQGLPDFSYLDRLPPKSLDRNDFLPVLDAVAGLSTEDGAATLAAFTADCVARGVAHMPAMPTRWLVCGGGRKNRAVMRLLADRLDAAVDPVEVFGLDGDMLEAQAFAYLAVRVLRGLPTSAPSTTGCRMPVSGGRIDRP